LTPADLRRDLHERVGVSPVRWVQTLDESLAPSHHINELSTAPVSDEPAKLGTGFRWR
jgi:hypothetical protein